MLASQNSSEDYRRMLLECTYGVCFLGTPHCGSDLTKWASVMGHTISLVKTTNNDLLNILKPDSEVLARIQHDFHSMLNVRRDNRLPVIKTSCYYEELPVKGVGFVSPLSSI